MTPDREKELADFKASVIKDFAKRFHLSTLVETGTWHGMTVDRCVASFKRIYSIEIDPQLANEAKSKFVHVNHVNIINGDSGQMLYHVLKIIQEPCLLWLDAHNGTASTPIVTELGVVLMLALNGSVILIDDLRDFNGRNGYPHAADLVKGLKQCMPNYTVEVADDILRAYPCMK